jgi:hypothetical protein
MPGSLYTASMRRLTHFAVSVISMVTAGVMSTDQRVQVSALPRALHWVNLSFTYCNCWLILGLDSGRVIDAKVGVEGAVGGRQCWVDCSDGGWEDEMAVGK